MYPKYKKKRNMTLKSKLLIMAMVIISISFLMPWVVYSVGGLVSILMGVHMYRTQKGFKKVCGLLFSVFLLLIALDLKDLSFTWSLDYVLPSFLLFVMVTLLFSIVLKKKNWDKHYDTHMYTLLISIAMTAMMLLGIISSVPLVTITLIIAGLSMVIIRLRVGKTYRKNIMKFIHI